MFKTFWRLILQWKEKRKKRERKKERNDHLNITLEKLALIRLEILNQSFYSFFGIFCPKFKQPTEQWYPKFEKISGTVFHSKFGCIILEWKIPNGNW